MNVLDNAIAYGRLARVESSVVSGRVRIAIRDGGPGIPPEHLASVLGPFVRLEGSRSRQTGGTGIGLTIAGNIISGLAGTITLHNHPQGGLEVVLDLPIAVQQPG